MSTQDRYYYQLAEAGRAVVERRLQLDMSQAALASAAGVDAKTLRSLERGERWPQDTSRTKVERALGWQDGTLQALFYGDFLWREVENPDGSRSGGIIYLRSPSEGAAPAAPADPPSYDNIDPAITDSDILAASLTASELAALLVTRSQSLERRVRELERERNELQSQLNSKHREDGTDELGSTASLEGDAQQDGVITDLGRRGRRELRGTSDPRVKILDDDVDEDILELPHAADTTEDPGEDDD